MGGQRHAVGAMAFPAQGQRLRTEGAWHLHGRAVRGSVRYRMPEHGHGGMAIREQAKAYLSDADAMKIVSQAMADKDAAETRAAHAEKRLNELEPLVNQMHAELMALKNAAPAVETFIQGVHDPVQQAMRAAPTAPLAVSSLDSLAVQRRPRAKADA